MNSRKLSRFVPFQACLVVVALPLGLWAQVQVVQISGKVEVRQSGSAGWRTAAVGTEVGEGGSVRTAEDGRAEVLFPNKTQIWLKERTEFQVEAQQPSGSLVSLLFGSIKARVPHLRWREKFQLRTPTAVAAVRGTEFTASADDKRTDIQTSFGEVNLSLKQPDGSFGEEVSVLQGNRYSEGNVQLTSKDQEKESLCDWSPGLKDQDRYEDLEDKDNARQEMQEYADRADDTEEMVENLVARAKEEDFAAGRTLIDVHGNLVRVDQRLIRPAANALQFVNLVKRPGYNYRGKLTYSGPAGARLDSASIRADFNFGLPQNLTDWPGFFASNESTLHIDRTHMLFTSQNGPDNVFVIGYFGERVPIPTDPDNFKTDLYTGIVGSLQAAGNKANLTRMEGVISPVGICEGTSCHTVGTPIPTCPAGICRDGEATGQLFSVDAEYFRSTGAGTEQFALLSENYVIGNDGRVRSVRDFTASSKDPFSLLRDTAGEIILSWRKTDASYNIPADGIATIASASITGWGGARADSRNIDLVIIPDLALAIAQKLITVIGEVEHK